MDRLTQWLSNGTCRVAALAAEHEEKHGTGELIDLLLDKLAEYEDTGLTPEGITTMANDIETRFLCYIEKTYGQAAGELLRIWEAAKDGRVVILPAPAKEGDPKPECFYNDNAGLWCNGMAPTDGDEPTERCKNCWYCESGYAAEEG